MNKFLKISDVIFIISKWVLIILILIASVDLTFSFIIPSNSLANDTSYLEDLYSYTQNWRITDTQIKHFPVVEYNRIFSIFILLLSVLSLVCIKYFRIVIQSTLKGALFSIKNIKIFRKYIVISVMFILVTFSFDLYVNHLMLVNFNAHSNLTSSIFEWIDSIISVFLTFVFYFLFKKGVSLKLENDLTI